MFCSYLVLLLLMVFTTSISPCIIFLLQKVKALMGEEKTKGFCQIVVSPNFRDGISCLIQSAGLGGMKHNTVLMAWPQSWKETENRFSWKNFVGMGFLTFSYTFVIPLCN